MSRRKALAALPKLTGLVRSTGHTLCEKPLRCLSAKLPDTAQKPEAALDQQPWFHSNVASGGAVNMVYRRAVSAP
jgi:hypothetical protein